jgi:phosphoglycolate phosphatase
MFLNSQHPHKSVLWDWNGTLLNDAELCRLSINKLLSDRGMKSLSRDRYKTIFTFPVKNYYVEAGFNFNRESWEAVVMEFMDHYRKGLGSCKIHKDARQVLERFRDAGWKQYLVSAMEHNLLLDLVAKNGLTAYFDGISGIEDHFAGGKAIMAGRYCKAKRIDPAASLLIGDTLHDYEVARSLGMQCVLVAAGHQSKERLQQAGCPVFNGLTEVESHLLKHSSELN